MWPGGCTSSASPPNYTWITLVVWHSNNFFALSAAHGDKALFHHQYPTMSKDSPKGTLAEAISVLEGMMPMIDSSDPHHNAFKMAIIIFVVVVIFFAAKVPTSIPSCIVYCSRCSGKRALGHQSPPPGSAPPNSSMTTEPGVFKSSNSTGDYWLKE